MSNELIISEFKKLISFTKDKIDRSHIINDNNKDIHRVNIFINALNIIKNLNFKIKSSDDLNGIYGIGSGIKRRVDEILKHGYLNEIEV